MAKTLKDLVLALLNATLILLALCLFLAWMVFDRANQVADTFADAVQVVTPLRTQTQEIVAQLEGLRGDLDALDKDTSVENVRQLAEIRSELATLNTQLNEVHKRIDDLSDKPSQLLDQTITATADAVAVRLTALRGCVPAPS